MSELILTHSLYLASFLFSAGVFVVLTKRNSIFVLIGVELMLNAANLVLASFSAGDLDKQGEFLGIFAVVITVCEVSVALAILLNVYRKIGVSNLDELKEVGNA